MIARVQATLPAASVRQICTTLGVSRSWYYAAQHRPAEREDAQQVARIEALILRFPGYGYRRITQALRRDGVVINHKRVQRLLREQSLLMQVRRAVQTTHRVPGWRTTPNRIAGLVSRGQTRSGWLI